MKKLFGVMVLAVLPVACGSTLPSGPDAAQPVSGDNASVTSLRKVRKVRTAPTPTPDPDTNTNPVPNCSTANDVNLGLVAINVSVVSRGSGFTILRAEPVFAGADAGVEPSNACFAPDWTLGEGTSRAYLEQVSDRQEIRLVASAGQYLVTASSANGDGRAIQGNSVVDIK